MEEGGAPEQYQRCVRKVQEGPGFLYFARLLSFESLSKKSELIETTTFFIAPLLQYLIVLTYLKKISKLGY